MVLEETIPRPTLVPTAWNEDTVIESDNPLTEDPNTSMLLLAAPVAVSPHDVATIVIVFIAPLALIRTFPPEAVTVVIPSITSRLPRMDPPLMSMFLPAVASNVTPDVAVIVYPEIVVAPTKPMFAALDEEIFALMRDTEMEEIKALLE